MDQRIVEVGYIEHGTGKHQSNTVYSQDGLSRTLQGGDWRSPIKIYEQQKQMQGGRQSELLGLRSCEQDILAGVHQSDYSLSAGGGITNRRLWKTKEE